MEVNGKKTQLTIKELVLTPVSLALMGEEFSSDCCVVVYAVDDTKSFGDDAFGIACYGPSNELFISALADTALAHLTSRDCFADKSVILVGNKTDLARSRLVQAEESCDAAVMAGVKFVDTSAMIGHMTNQLLVGIVMQCRLVLGYDVR